MHVDHLLLYLSACNSTAWTFWHKGSSKRTMYSDAHTLPLIMVDFISFVDQSCQEVQQNTADEDNHCYPVYQPYAQTMSVEALLAHLCCEASNLRCQLSAVEFRITQLATAMASLCMTGSVSDISSYSCIRQQEQHALEKIARRKVANKKIGEWPARLHLSQWVPSQDLGRRLLEQRASAYEQGDGPNDSGITISSSDWVTESEAEDFDTCILCRELALHTCPCGCGCFCQVCHNAHMFDGRHWAA